VLGYRNVLLRETTTLCTCLRATWTGSTGETLEVIRHSLPHWTIPIRGSACSQRCCFIVVRPVRTEKAGAFIESKRSVMEWFHSSEREQERPNGGLASSHEIQTAFDEQRDNLYWIALLITGDDALADLAVVNASALSSNYSSVFRDWLNGWAKYATVRAAVREVRNLISATASHYVDSSSEHCDDDVLSDDQIMSLRHVDPREIITALDPLARCALVLRGIEHASLVDCALLLDVSRGIVARAYSQALRWNGELRCSRGGE
jgi:DNA-directed RNA polymerase specialized sigma24 family protein